MLRYFRCRDGRIEAFDRFEPRLLNERPGDLHWIDLEEPTAQEAAILQDPFRFHPLAIEDCLVEIQHPKLDDYDDYVLVVLHGVRPDAPDDAFETRELDIFLGPNYLVTHHDGPLRSVSHTRELCGKGMLSSFGRGVDFLLHTILDEVFQHYFPCLDAIEDKIQLVQVEIFDKPTRGTVERIFSLKQDVMRLRRFCTPQREIVNRLSRGELKVVSPRAAVYFRDIHDSLYRLVEASLQYQDDMQGTLDAYLGSVSNRLNETMKRLTVFGAVFAAVTVIAGVYGMNFDHMPELKWRYGYLVVLIVMAASSGGLLYAFKKKGWL